MCTLEQDIQTRYKDPNFTLASVGLPEVCNFCNTKLEINEDFESFVWCPNPVCHRKIYGNLDKFLSVFDLKGVGDQTIATLAENETISRPSQFFTLTEAQFTSVERKGEKHFARYNMGLDKLKATPVPLYKVLASLNVQYAGEGFWKTVTEKYETWEAVCEMLSGPPGVASQKMAVLPRVSEKSARSAVRARDYIFSEVTELLKYLSVQSKVIGKLTGKKFAQTGGLSRINPATGKRMSRAELQATIESFGGAFGDSITKETFLVIDDKDSTSSKAVKARKVGATLLTEDDLFALIEG